MEDIDRSEEPVKRLLGDLGRVDAPPHFETRVMARIAEVERVPTPASSLSLAVRIALPLVLVLSIGGYLLYVGFGGGQTPQVASPGPVRNQPSAVENTPQAVPDQFAQTENIPQTTVTGGPDLTPRRRSNPIVRTTAVPNANRGGGSFEKAAEPEKVLLPTGIPTTFEPSAANRGEVIRSATVPAREVLALIGISAEFDGGWKVKSLAANSLAERSGVKTEDVVTALDEKRLTADTEFSGDVAVKTITVSRGGSAIVLKLRPN